MSDDFTLDANAVAGMLQEIYGTDMTAHMSECSHCGNKALVGTMRAYDMAGPGVVLRCSACAGITLVIVPQRDGSYWIEASATVELDS